MTPEPTYLYLTDNFRIFRCDDRNLEVEHRREVVSRPNRYVTETTSTVKWVSVGYFSHIHQAVARILSGFEEELIVKDKMDLSDFLVELKEIKDDLVRKVSESGIQVEHFVKTVDGRGKKAGSAKETPNDTPKEKARKGRGRPRKVKV